MNKQHTITMVDTTLRDGSHAVSHGFTTSQVRQIASMLDSCGVPIIEVSHGDGLGGSSYTYGFSKVDQFELISAAASKIKNGKLAVLLIPGIGTTDDLKHAKDCGAKVVRIATHATEADVSAQHIGAAKSMDMMAVGFLMMAHMLDPEGLAEQAKKMESYGADYVNLADSAGALLPEQVSARIKAIRAAVSIPVGFHAHNNLGLAVANTLAAIDAGASYADGTLRGLGAGAGNTQIEVLAGVLSRKGIETGLDFYGLIDASEKAVAPLMLRPQIIDSGSLMLGYAGVYSSFLLHVYAAAGKYGVEPRDILVEVGKRKMVGGQEDLIVDVAYELKKMESTFDIFQIRLPDGKSFSCRSDESVLEAMRRSGSGPISYGCFGGGCGVCAMRVVSGEYCRFHPMSRAHISANEEQNGCALMCCIKPLSDLSLDFKRDKNKN